MSLVSATTMLETLNLPQYTDAFAYHCIDPDMLDELTDECLREIGVTAMGHRLKILKFIRAHCSTAASSATASFSASSSSAPNVVDVHAPPREPPPAYEEEKSTHTETAFASGDPLAVVIRILSQRGGRAAATLVANDFFRATQQGVAAAFGQRWIDSVCEASQRRIRRVGGVRGACLLLEPSVDDVLRSRTLAALLNEAKVAQRLHGLIFHVARCCIPCKFGISCCNTMTCRLCHHASHFDSQTLTH